MIGIRQGLFAALLIIGVVSMVSHTTATTSFAQTPGTGDNCPGPDAFGYVCESTTGRTYVAGANLVPSSGCDDCVFAITLPFNFNYGGQVYAAGSTIHVSTNGTLQFTSTDASYSNTTLSSTGALGAS